MKGFYSHYIDDDSWLIKENKWEHSLQNIHEALFSLGNGYLGVRAVLEEIPLGAMPGTYIAGVYDKMFSQVAELVNLPNPFNFTATAEGEKIALGIMDVLKHQRILNLKKGLLLRHTLYQSSKEHRFDYQCLRFVSMKNKNTGVMQIALTPLDSACEIDINTQIDTSVYNGPILTEGQKRHFRIKELGQFRNAGYLLVQTPEKKHTIVYWSGLYYEINGRKILAKDSILKIKLKKGQTIIFTKIFCIKCFPSQSKIVKHKREAFKKFYKVLHTEFDVLVEEHIKSWEKLWQKAGILVEGKADLQQNIRFNIYHMLICAPADNGFSSIGARTLTGEGYRGHIFWDAEIFLMPFYLFTMPKIAKNILLYRCSRLKRAREIAKKLKFRGIMFPWESADTGEEETPAWARDIDGSITKVYTHKMEHHITADIAYAVYNYFIATGDERFMERYGYEVLFETARFWVSRAEYNKEKNRYEINHVIGPDEFHVNVNNNAYTNMMAKWNLTVARKMFYKIREDAPSVSQRLQRKLKLKCEEVKNWKKVASLISINMNKEGVIEQFDGYFKLKKVILTETDENGMPVLPRGLKIKELAKTQLVKQADTLMLLYLLSDNFDLKTKKVNYDFYIKRTLHKSSLSPSIHSILALECRDLHRAYDLFNVSLCIDINNLYGNTKDGIHGACLGGTWQAIVFGFAGISIKEERLFIDPRMPRSWKRMIFSLFWKGKRLKLDLTNESIKLRAVSSKEEEIEIGIFDKLTSIRTNEDYVFEREMPALITEYYY
ncbi:MAG: glycoside hydrolase family 65 protein [Deltaproteobacteria bacterium]|nr:glycoside hydrolase family 65 protein [Deltaproteobacteria bacterium]